MGYWVNYHLNSFIKGEQMKKLKLLSASTLIVLIFSTVVFAGRPEFYPFDVKVAGQLGVPAANQVAKIANSVTSDADVEVVATVTDTMFVNIFASDPKGLVANTTSPEIILVNGSNKFKLNQTMSKKTLPPGNYMMNIMANNVTSRILFTVK